MFIQIQWIKQYLKEKKLLIMAYILGVTLLILYYFLESEGQWIILYPIVLTGFVLVVFMTLDLYEYRKQWLSLESLKEDSNYDLPATSHLFCIVNDINQQYRQERLNIQRANDENNQMISQWIHHMKTPISVIDLIIQKLEKDCESSILMTDLKQENNKLHSRLEQVLTLTRLKDFHRDYEPTRIDVVSIIKSLINENKRQFIYHGVFPKFEETKEILILSDEKWLRIMIDQLLSNGIKYSKKDEAPSYVTVTVDVKDKYVVIEIKDNGIGIEAYDLPKVFNPFFTGDNGRHERNSSGIGLYICQCIAQELGHEIEIQSSVNIGTEVKLKCLTGL